MKVGTKSLLFGYHQLLLHPLFVWAGWLKLYGWTWDPRIMVAFFVHDIGYWGKPNMDGVEGEQHPFFGAKVLHFLFDKPAYSPSSVDPAKWYKFSLYHSRKLAWMYCADPSRLCWADKMAWMLYPKWLLRLMYALSGEGEEYLSSVTIDIKGTKIVPQRNWDAWYDEVWNIGVRMLREAGYKGDF
jgi:hypothetical protein